MKFVRLFAVATLVSAFATASFAGSCCSKKKECPPDQAKQEQPAQGKKAPAKPKK